MVTMHLFTVVMAWHDESIKIHICSPTGAQVREYVALKGRCPSGTQAQILDGELASQSSPSEPQGSKMQLHLAIRELNDTQLREELEEISTLTWVTPESVVGPYRRC